MSKAKLVFSIIILFMCLESFSQVDDEKKWDFVFNLDNRFSSIRNRNIVILGIKTGIQYKKYVRFGVGFSFIANPVNIEYLNKKIGKLETNNINLWYASGFADLILYKNKKWECFVTEQIGYGKPNFTREISDEIVKDLNVGLAVNEISGQIDYKLTNWLGIGVGFGYRNILNKQDNLKNTFNAPIYILKLIILTDCFLKKH